MIPAFFAHSGTGPVRRFPVKYLSEKDTKNLSIELIKIIDGPEK